IGKRSPAAIQAGILHQLPFRRIAFGQNQRYVDVTLQDGSQLQGLVKNEDSFSVVLQTLEGDYRLLDRRRIRAMANSTRTLMPTNAAERPSADQTADLLAYLSQQKQRGVVSADAADESQGLTFARLKSAEREPQNWLTYWGNYASEHFS